jgi:hypothetical protein
MSRLNDGVCVLGFSRGKDSLAAWLYLRNYFDTIIPFHSCIIPGLDFVERSLTYYENVMNTKIERLMSGVIPDTQQFGIFQTFNMYEILDTIGLPIYHPGQYQSPTAHLLAKEYGLENHWPAYGFSMYDSLDRIKWVRDCKGKHDKWHVWYPCWNWKPTQIRDYVKSHDISLPEDYLLTNRTLDDLPHFYHLEKIKEKYPEDFETIKLWYPLIEARMARQTFREQHVQN